MPKILLTIGGLAAVAVPFLLAVWLMGRTSRNEGELHGGGFERYQQVRSGRTGPMRWRRGKRRKY